MTSQPSVELHTPSTILGQRLLPTTIDERASSNPQTVWCSLPYDDDDLSKGYEDITYVKFATAINQIAWFIQDSFGPSKQFATIAYIGAPDVRCQILEMAAAKTGYQVLFSSHMNNLAGHLSLMGKTDATILLSASQAKVDDILASRLMKHKVIPELDTLLAANHVKNYPYLKTFAQAKNDPFVVFHTSGSTGLPKPIIYTHGAVAAMDHHRSMPDVDPASGLPVRFFLTGPDKPTRMLIPFLHFHCIANTVAMVGSVFHDLVYVPGFRHKMVATNDVFSILEHSNVETAFFSPAMVEDLARHPDVGKYISRLDKCLYGGAPVTEAAGKVFSRFTHLQSQWGISETVKLIDLTTEPEDFAYCGFEIKHSGISFELVAANRYEMIIRRTEDSYPNVGMFWRCPEEHVFRPGDLWSPHPDPRKAKYLWKYEGRLDDIIVYKDGINLDPLPYESKHSEHDLVRSAVMAGVGHRQAVLLLELYPESGENESEIIERIWKESVMPINSLGPTNARVERTHIVLAWPHKPFERNVKGTVARKATLRKYHPEIESIYERHGDRTVKVDARLSKN